MEPIAIIGIGCRFPGDVRNPQELWALLLRGQETVGEIPADRFHASALFHPEPQTPGRISSPYGSFLREIDTFDAEFFGISAREAAHLDPQQRLLLEVAWESLEDAGLAADRLAGSDTGVFLGLMSGDYEALLAEDVERLSLYSTHGTGRYGAAGRLSFTFGFEGPSMVVDTACSSSLLAVHLACQSLRTGECDLALAGGANLILRPEVSIMLSQGDLLAKDGRSKFADAQADGFGRGEGAGLVVLKTLEQAKKDGDPIYAQIRGGAVRHDGQTHRTLPSPSQQAQEALLRRALRAAGTIPEEIGYLEAHGTGTQAGDRAELRAMAAVFAQRHHRPCPVGSVKGNLGHGEGAAGVAGLIKLALALQHRVLPPSVCFSTPTPAVDWEKAGIRVQNTTGPWPGSEPAIGGVNSFGLSGTNVHLVLEEVPEPQRSSLPPSSEGDEELLFLSAKTPQALTDLTTSFGTFLASHPTSSLREICTTARNGRCHFSHRLALAASSVEELARSLQAPLAVSEGSNVRHEWAERYLRGEDPEHFMGEETYRPRRLRLPTYPFQRQRFWLPRKYSTSAPVSPPQLPKDWIYQTDWQEQPLHHPGSLQLPYPSTLQNHWDKLLKDWRSGPEAAVFQRLGPQLDSLVVAYIVHTLRQAAGGFHPKNLLKEHSLATKLGVVKERLPLLRRLLEILAEHGLLAHRPPQGWEVISAPPMEDPLAKAQALGARFPTAQAELTLLTRGGTALGDILRGTLNPSEVLFWDGEPSSLPTQSTPERLLESVSTLFCRHPPLRILNTLLSSAVEQILAGVKAKEHLRLLEVGAGTGGTTASLLPQLGRKVDYWWTDTSPFFLKAARRRFAQYPFLRYSLLDLEEDPNHQGFDAQSFDLIVAANVLHATQDLRRTLRRVHGLLAPGGVLLLLELTAPQGFIELSFGLTKEWWHATDQDLRPTSPLLTTPLWRQLLQEEGFNLCCEASAPFHNLFLASKEVAKANRDAWLFWGPPNALGVALGERLKEEGGSPIFAFPGAEFDQIAPQSFQLNPDRPEDAQRLLQTIRSRLPTLSRVILLAQEHQPSVEAFAEVAETLAVGVLHLLQAVVGARLRPRVSWITRGAFSVRQNESVSGLAQAPLWGFATALAHEHPELAGARVDLDPEKPESEAHALWRELQSNGGELRIALRHGKRYVARLQPSTLSSSPQSPSLQSPSLQSPSLQSPSLSSQATYLITGGLGRLGLLTARTLVQHGARHLILAGRQGADSFAADSPGADALRQLERSGAQVRIRKVDVSRKAQVHGLLNEITTSGPPLKGILHAAGNLDDGILVRQTAERLRQVLAPKVAGAWNLHTLSHDSDLDFFVLFSSITATFGSPGQTSHGAANAFLDALAHHRRSQGLPGISLGWGLWRTESGAEEFSPWFKARGFSELPSERGVEFLAQLLGSREAHRLITPVDWSLFRSRAEDDLRTFCQQFPSPTSPRPTSPRNTGSPIFDEPTSTSIAWRQAPTSQRRQLLLQALAQEIAPILEMEIDEEVSQPLSSLGLDSLMAVELRSCLRQHFGADLAVEELLAGPTLEQIAERIEISLPAPTISNKPSSAAPWFPMSHGQRAMWFLCEKESTSTAYHVGLAMRLLSPLKIPCLHRALQRLQQQHPSLRTVFDVRGEEFVQRVLPAQALAFTDVDAGGWSPEALERRVREAAREPFDLQTGPVFKSWLFRRGEEQILLLSLHHMVCDGWSMWLLTDQLWQLYAAETRGGLASLPPLPADIADFVDWQREFLASPQGQRQRKEWQQRLAGELPTLALPFDRPRPQTLSPEGKSFSFRLSPSLLTGFDQLARGQGNTLFQTTLAGFTALLHRLTGETDLLLGTPMLGRQEEDFIPLVGYLVNTVVLRLDLANSPTGTQLLAHCRETVLDAISRQNIPFSMVVEDLAPERDASLSPCFQVAFVHLRPQLSGTLAELLASDGEQVVVREGIALRAFELEQQDSRYDLTVEIVEGSTAPRVVLRYHPKLFDETTIRRLAAQFQTLLTALVEDSSRHLAQLPLLNSPEHHQLVVEWGGRQDLASPPSQLLPQAFQSWAERIPHALALRDCDQQLSYGELADRAGKVAAALNVRGMGPEALVGLFATPSVTTLMGLLGILQAGAAYVALDPAHPPERLVQLAQAAGLQHLLFAGPIAPNLERRSATSLGSLRPERTLEMYSIENLAAGRGLENAQRSKDLPLLDAQQAAYVVYTSGSSGQPKGVVVSHEAVAHLFAASGSYFSFGSEDSFTLFHSLAFDFSVWELWGALAHGGRLVVVSQEVRRSPQEFDDLLRAERVTVVNQTPSAFYQWMPSVRSLPALRQIIFGGETLDEEPLRPWFKDCLSFEDRPSFQDLRDASFRLVNMYGITETTVHITQRRLGRRDLSEALDVGRALPHLYLRVLDPRGNPLPIGVAGEVHVGGTGLSRGYLDDPAKTADAFRPDPASATAGARMYRSGDVGRLHADGRLEIRGRMDQQIQLRGFRIEPGEIEALLTRQPVVREAVVAVREDPQGHPRLTCWLGLVHGSDEQKANWRKDRVSHWKQVYEELYEDLTPKPEADFCGWVSSITGLPFLPAEMHEWRDHTVQRIRELRPQRVLEIGCGTGMLLQDLSPHCQHYVATDFSPKALAHLRRSPRLSPNVQLFCRPADDFTDLEQKAFDTVVLNSVVQYFPDVEYLLKVLRRAVRVTAPGGSIFLGDVRNLCLLEAQNVAVELTHAAHDLDLTNFQDRVLWRGLREEEFALAPDFFLALPRRLPRIRGVSVRPRLGHFQNEMNQFRYDVVLQLDEDPSPLPKNLEEISATAGLSLENLRARLQTEPVALAARRWPHPLLLRERQWLHLLSTSEGTVGALRTEIEERLAVAPPQTEPMAFFALAQELGYSVHVLYSRDGNPGDLDLLFLKTRDGDPPSFTYPVPASASLPHITELANKPLSRQLVQEWVPRLRQSLRRQLPEHMVPAHWIVLPALPRLANGKLDRRSLPPPDPGHRDLKTMKQAPRTAAERTLAEVWKQYLNLDAVSRTDNFFDLGGDSILSIRIVSEAYSRGWQLRPRDLFLHPVLQELARVAQPTQPSSRTPSKPNSPFPLSPIQEGLLFHSLDADRPTYIEQFSFSLRGPLHIPAFLHAWQRLIHRHEALRTAFNWEVPGAPFQEIWENTLLPFQVLDWSQLPKSTREECLAAFFKTDQARAFSPHQPPLMRLTVIQFNPRLARFVWTFHHAILDGWSWPLLLEELFEIYENARRGRGTPSRSTLSYRHYVQWIRSQDHSPAEDFWRKELHDLHATTPFPPRRKNSTLHSSTVIRQLRVAPQTEAALRQKARLHGLTLNTLVQGAWALLLARMSDEQRIFFGVTVSSRPAELGRADAMIGLYINTLAARVEVAPEQPLLPFLSELQDHQAKARQFDFLSLVKLKEWSGLEGEQPLFETLLVFDNFPVSARLEEWKAHGLGDLKWASTPHLPFTLLAVPDREMLLLALFDPSRLEVVATERLLRHLAQLLRAMVEGMESSLAELSHLSPAERHQLVHEWNHRIVDSTNLPNLVHETTLARADQTPHTLAVVFGHHSLSYGELARRSEESADGLRGQGVRPEVRIAVESHRSIELMVAVLACLRAGGVVVPLDTSWPRRRVEAVLERSRATVLWAPLSNTMLRLPSTPPPSPTALRDAPNTSHEPIGRVRPENPVYAIYTSGSTGDPKGILLTHGALRDLVLWQTRTSLAHRTLQFAPLSFDVAWQEIFSTWSAGGTLHVIPESVRQDSAAWLQTLCQQRIERLFLPVVALERLAEIACGSEQIPRSLVEVLTAGEALRVTPAVRRFFAALPGATLHNQYGPAEAHVVTDQPLGGNSQDWPEHPPMGRPVSRAQVFLLDSHLHPVPSGLEGDLYIAGTALARGYLERPAWTAARFLPNPFTASGPGGHRLYRTGDRARYLSNGAFDFLGRKDRQLKIRGFRIEPGEVESVLRGHPEIENAVVQAASHSASSDRPQGLVAWLEVGSTEPNSEDLQHHLRQHLPSAMIPATFLFLKQLPRSAAGKLDFKALPPPPFPSPLPSTSPRSALEGHLGEIFCQVLGCQQVDPRESFFTLGGHSLRVMEVLARVRRMFSVELTPQDLFDHPTLEQFTAMVASALGHHRPALSSPIPEPQRKAEAPLTFAQRRLWFLAQFDPESTAYHLPVALHFRGPLVAKTFRQAFDALTQRHEILQVRFLDRRGEPRQWISGITPPLLRVDLERLSAANRKRVARHHMMALATHPFPLHRGPLFAAVLFHLEAESNVLVLRLHHLLADGWSLGVLMRDLQEIYEGFRVGRSPRLPKLTLHYFDVARWQHRSLQEAEMTRQIEFWQENLAGLHPLHLPTDRPRRLSSPRAGSQGLNLPTSCLSQLEELGSRTGTSIFMILLAAFMLLLRRLTEQPDFAVGTPVAGRHRGAVEELVGLFAHQLVLRVPGAKASTFLEFLKQVRTACLDAFAHPDLPLEKLVEALCPTRQPGQNPLFQVSLSLEAEPLLQSDCPGLRVEPLELPPRHARFDLELALRRDVDHLAGSLIYDAELFHATTAERWARSLIRLITGAAAEPRRDLEDLPWLDPAERHQLLFEWSHGISAPSTPEIFLHQLFAAQARRRPEAVVLREACLRGGRRQLSNGQCLLRSQRLAQRLRQQGVGPEQVVGLFLPRSIPMVIALLGILEAGGAYCPIPLEETPARRKALLDEAQVRLLITAEPVPEDLSKAPLQRICLQPDRCVQRTRHGNDIKDATPKTASPLPTRRDHPAYVLFTSGTTGRPKGVVVTHRALTQYLFNARQIYGSPPGYATPVHTNLRFDLTVTSLFLPLVTGGCLLLAPERSATEPPLDLLQAARGASLLKLTPSHLQQLSAMSSEDPGQPATPRSPMGTFVIGGEALHEGSLTALKKYAPGARLFNEYGPTEAVVGCSVYEIPRGEGMVFPSTAVPIGRPLPYVRIFLLDSSLRPTAMGTPGELFIGGTALARGYQNNPRQTAEAFVPNPFGGFGTRLYRTGDRAVHLWDSQLIFSGRRDQQLKIRGWRVESGEIEAELRQHPAAREAAVMLQDLNGRGQRLVAFMAVGSKPAKRRAELRESFWHYAQQRLPHPLVPTIWCLEAELPRLGNGKIDRRSLRPPDHGKPHTHARYQAPRTPHEEALARIWTRVLGLSQVGIADNFFDVGGDSLSSLRVVHEARREGIEITLRQLFEAPNIAQLAKLLSPL